METDKMTNLEEIKRKWYHQRKLATIFGVVQQCMFYFEYLAIAISGLYYYQTSFNVTNSNFYYGCLMSALFFSSIFSVYFCGKIMDKTRNLRGIVMVLHTCNIAGNLIYTSTLSPWCPIIGRLICGISIGAIVVFSGNARMLIFFKKLISLSCKDFK